MLLEQERGAKRAHIATTSRIAWRKLRGKGIKNDRRRQIAYRRRRNDLIEMLDRRLSSVLRHLFDDGAVADARSGVPTRTLAGRFDGTRCWPLAGETMTRTTRRQDRGLAVCVYFHDRHPLGARAALTADIRTADEQHREDRS